MKYTPLHQTSHSPLKPTWTWPISIHNFTALPSLLTITTALSTVFLAGMYTQHLSSSHTHITDPIPLDIYTNVFHYNSTFAGAPSAASTAAWTSIFPVRGGYFSHPQIAPARSDFAVFHQLHCLVSLHPIVRSFIDVVCVKNGIRQGYWMLHEAVLQGRKLEEDEIPFMASPTHIRHCVDLIRQSLQCRPDLTVEVKDEELGGVTGFGTAHTCRNWSQLLEWLQRWE